MTAIACKHKKLIGQRLLTLVAIGLFSLGSLWSQGSKIIDDGFTIGLLVNDENELEATYSAQFLVEKINKNGGINGHPVSLVIRSVEGSWGTGSNEVVKMVFQDEVDVILGSIDGRNSHLAEQVIAKTQVLYVSAWSSDPTLTQAYVPYYFSVVPTDEQQASQIIDQMSGSPVHGKCLVLYDASYDASQALISFRSASETHNQFSFNERKISTPEGIIDLKKQIQRERFISYVLLGKNLPLSEIMQLLQDQKNQSSVYVNLQAMSSPEINSIGGIHQGEIVKNYVSVVANDEFENLRAEFRKAYGTDAGLISAYVYDGMKIISQALKRSDSDLGKLKVSLAETKYQGVTGKIEFDDNGKLKTVPVH